MKHEALKICAVCKGSGIDRNVGDPGLEDHRWCASCEAGRAKAQTVAEIINRSLSESVNKAA